MSQESSRKIESCFQKLYKIITRNKLSLWKVFNDFDKKKGSLTLQDFALLIKKLSGNHLEVTDEEIRLGFELIDEDRSNSIEFQELNKYYCKINGIPNTIGTGNDRMDVESPSHYGHGQHYSPNHPVSPPPQNQQSNPFYQINQAFVHQQQQQGFNQQFSQNKNYQPGYNSQSMNQQGYGYSQNSNQSFPNNNQYPPGNYPPNQYPPNAYQNQGPQVPGTPPYQNTPPGFNPLDFLRK